MLYVQLDTNWINNPKIVRAGMDGAGLHAHCLCLAKTLNTDGWIDLIVLARLGASEALVDRLVELELLERDGDRVRPWDWHERNMSKAAIKASRDAKVRAGKAGNHKRYDHPGPLDECRICFAETLQTPSVLAPAIAGPSQTLAGLSTVHRSESESTAAIAASDPAVNRAGIELVREQTGFQRRSTA